MTRLTLHGLTPAVHVGRLVPLLVVSLEVLWSYRWLAWVSTWEGVGWARPPLALGSALVLALATEALARFALGRHWALSQVRWLLLPALIALLALAVRLDQGGGYALWDPGWAGYALGHISPLVGGLAFGVYLLWRGISVGRENLPLTDLYPRFAVGLVALVLLQVLSNGSSPTPPDTATSGLYLMAYFALGLLALALANLEAVQRQMRHHQEGGGTFQGRWVAIVVGLIFAIMALSLALASPFFFDLIALLLQPLGVLADWLLTIFVYAVGYPLGLLVTALVYLLRFLLYLLRRGQAPPPMQAPDLSDLPRVAQGQEAGGIPLWAVLSLKWGLVALLVFLVLFFLARALVRYWKEKPEEEIEEVSESLWSLEAFQDDLRSLLRGLLGWLKHRKRQALAAASPPISVVQGDSPARLFSVREIYRGLLWEGQQQGLPRRTSETPYEYGSRLEQGVMPDLLALQAITEAYVSDRYGDRPATGESLLSLNRHWQRLRSWRRSTLATPKP